MDSDDDIFPSEDSDMDSEDHDPDEHYIFPDPEPADCQPLVGDLMTAMSVNLSYLRRSYEITWSCS